MSGKQMQEKGLIGLYKATAIAKYNDKKLRWSNVHK